MGAIKLPPSGTVTLPIDIDVRFGDGGDDDPARSDPLVAEIEYVDDQTGEYDPPQLADWLAHPFKITWPINRLPFANLKPRLSEGLLVCTEPTVPPTLANLDTLLPDDARITIRTARPDPTNDLVLFRGHPQRLVRKALGKPSGKQIDASLTLVHVGDSLDADLSIDSDGAPLGQLQGQWWIPRGDLPAFLLDPTTPTDIRHVPALPAVFNPDGRPNCMVWLVRGSEPAPDQGQPDTWYAPVCTHADDSEVQHWTWARVFLLLFYLGRRQTDKSVGARLRGGLVDRNLTKMIVENNWHKFDPALSAPATDVWGRLLTGVPRSFSWEGMSWLDAITWTCAKCGIGFVVDTWADGVTGEAREGFRFVVPGEQRAAAIKLASPHFTTHDKPWSEVKTANDVTNFELTRDFGTCVNAAIGIGAAQRYEITVELVPGWKYDAARDPQVDFDPAATGTIDAAVEEMLNARGDDESNWYRRYNRAGAEHDLHADVLRLWILPDSEDLSLYTDPPYARPWGHWTASKYEIFDFGTLELGELGPGPAFDGDKLSVRPRPLGPCLTGTSADNPFPAIVRLSINAGTSWSGPLPIGARLLSHRCGLYFEHENLAQFVAASVTFAEAYMRGDLRVRVTATIAGDAAAESGLVESALSLSKRTRGKLLVRPDQFVIAIRDDKGFEGVLSGGNSEFKGSGRPAAERYDQDDLDRVADVVHRGDRVRTTGPVTMPGLRIADSRDTSDADLRPGDEVLKIAAEAGHDEHDLNVDSRDDGTHAMIAAVSYEYNPGSKDESPLATTTVTIEDPASLISFGAPSA